MAAKRRRKPSSPANVVVTAPAVSPDAGLSPSLMRDRGAATVYGVFFFLLFLACSPALDSKFSLPKLMVLAAGVVAFCALLLARHWRGRNLAPSPPALFLALALGGWWVLSTPFALHLPTALNGEYDYYNGLWTHLCCLALFVVSMVLPADLAGAKRIVAFLVAAIAAVAAINIAEIAGLSRLGLAEVSTLGDRVGASALMNFAIPFSAVALIRARHWGRKVGLGALLALLLTSEFLSQGRGAWLGLAVAVIILVIGLTRAGSRWKAMVLLAAALLVLAGLAARLNPLVAERFASLTRLTQDEAIGQRFIYYRAALRAIQEHPLAGIGFENFRNSYPRYRGADDIYFFDNTIPTMVHNGYLETALNNGIPALVLYLALIAVVLIALGRALSREAESDRRDFLLCLFAALVAYLVQDLSGWLDLGLAPAFWIMLGLAMNQAGRTPPLASDVRTRPLLGAFAGLTLLLGLYLVHDAYARVMADRRLFQAQALDVATQWRETESLVEQALVTLPADSRSESVAAHIYVNRFMAAREPRAYARGRELLELSLAHNPFDRMRLVNIVALEATALEMGQIDAASAFARQALSVLAETDRDNPPFHEFSARFFAAQGRFDEAVKAIAEARRLAPQEPRFGSIEAGYRAQLATH